MTGLSLPAAVALAVEVVHKVPTGAPLSTGIGAAVIDV